MNGTVQLTLQKAARKISASVSEELVYHLRASLLLPHPLLHRDEGKVLPLSTFPDIFYSVQAPATQVYPESDKAQCSLIFKRQCSTELDTPEA